MYEDIPRACHWSSCSFAACICAAKYCFAAGNYRSASWGKTTSLCIRSLCARSVHSATAILLCCGGTALIRECNDERRIRRWPIAFSYRFCRSRIRIS